MSTITKTSKKKKLNIYTSIIPNKKGGGIIRISIHDDKGNIVKTHK